jgi:hypothetical protein
VCRKWLKLYNYEILALLLIVIMQGKFLLTLSRNKLRCVNCIAVIFGPIVVAFISLYPKSIGSVQEGREYMTVGGDRAFLVVVPW